MNSHLKLDIKMQNLCLEKFFGKKYILKYALSSENSESTYRFGKLYFGNGLFNCNEAEVI